MNLLHRWTRKRLEKAIYHFKKLIPKQDLELIDSLLDKIVFTEDTAKTAEAGAGILENGKFCIVFFVRYLWYKSSEHLLVTVAHEYAHVFLEHNPKHKSANEEEDEEAVEKQLEAWGIAYDASDFISQFIVEHPSIYKTLQKL